MQAFLSDKGALGLYHCGFNLNWDFAEPTIEWLIAHPECPRAIASNIFWKSGVEFFVSQPDDPFAQDRSITDAILKRWKGEGFPSFGWGDPEPVETRYELDYYHKSEGVMAAGNPLGIPDDLFELVEGTIPEKPPVLDPLRNQELHALFDDLGTYFGAEPEG